MAKKKKIARRRVERDESIPEGFESLLPSRVDGYVRAEEGATVQGIVLDRYTKRGRYAGHYYQIQLTAPCAAQVANPDTDEYETQTLEAGKVVSIDERSSLECLAEKKGWEVFIRFLQKEDLEDGGTYWRMKVAAREVPF